MYRCIIALLCALILTTGGASADDIHVGYGESIQGAINDANDGDSIYLYAGNYDQHFIINKSISLYGDKGATAIDTEYSSMPVMRITADDVTVYGIAMSGVTWDSTYTIDVDNVDNCAVTDCIITNSYNGILVNASDNMVFSDNMVYGGPGQAVRIIRSDGGIYHNNVVSDYKVAFNVLYADNTVLTDNRINGTRQGIVTKYDIDGNGTYTTIRGNAITNNTMDAINIGCYYATVERNVVMDTIGTGIYARNAVGARITNNTLYRNDDGIVLSWECFNCTLDGNVVHGHDRYDGLGIGLYGNTDATMYNNTMYDNTYNLDVGGSYEPHFRNNIDTTNTVDGKPVYYWHDRHYEQIPLDAGFIMVAMSDNITIRDISIRNSADGVMLYGVKDSLVENITITDCCAGVFVDYCDTVDVVECNITGCTAPGIILITSYNCMIYGNYVVDNYIGVSLKYASLGNVVYNNYLDNMLNGRDIDGNEWNITLIPGENIIGGDMICGNYWADYAGTDADGDGIGDTPYTQIFNYTGICDSVDYLPLVPQETFPSCGDVDGSGAVTISDVVHIYLHVLNNSHPINHECIADVDNNGMVTISDVVHVYLHVLNSTYTLNCDCGAE